jgi:hypothetical protein
LFEQEHDAQTIADRKTEWCAKAQGTEEQRAKAWNNKGLPEWVEAWKTEIKLNDKKKHLILQMQQSQSLMPDMHNTFNDAKLMYDFLAHTVCKQIEDITFMCDRRDYLRLIEKPVYEGDFLRQMFDWNENAFQAK